VCLVLAAPGLFFGAPLPAICPNVGLRSNVFAASFVAATLVLIARERSGRSTSLGTLLTCLAAAYVPTFALSVAHEGHVVAQGIALELALGVLFRTELPLCAPVAEVRAIPAVLAVLTAVSIKQVSPPCSAATQTAAGHHSAHQHGLYDLTINDYQNSIPLQRARGGGLAKFGDRYLLAPAMEICTRVRDERWWRRTAGRATCLSSSGKTPLKFFVAAGTAWSRSWFRTADILTQEKNGKLRLFATHHFWKVAERCFVMRVSAAGRTGGEFWTRAVTCHGARCSRPRRAWPIVYPGRATTLGGIRPVDA